MNVFIRVTVCLFILLLLPRAQLYSADEAVLSQEALLDTIQEKTFGFFRDEVNKKNGLTPDKSNNFNKGATKAAASIASVGFALTAYPVGVERGWMDYSTAYELSRRTLMFFLKEAPHEHGFFYHFLSMTTGERAHRSEVSPIDTALFLAGALFAAEYFDQEELRDLVRKIYERIDFNWILNGKKTLSLSWSPEEGFSRNHWDHYDESMILYLLAIGSPTHPIPASSWKEIHRPVGSYQDYRVIVMPPLFTHQYSHIWIDFRNKNDGYADYFKNSVNATLANRAFCMDQSNQFSTYGPHTWGLTASDGPFGYKAYGAPPGWAQHDGTIAPTACGSSIVFTPELSLACLENLYTKYKDRIWGLYGFSDSFNWDKNWVSQDVLGIDQGPLLLMIENYRSELIWKTMTKNVFIQKAMTDIGFREGSVELPWPDPPSISAQYVQGGMRVDGFLRDWSSEEVLILNEKNKESGTLESEKDLSAEIRFAWDELALYFSAKVADDSTVLKRVRQHIWRDDALELFIDPGGDGLNWQDKQDLQIGFRPQMDSEDVLAWEWFQLNDDPLATGMTAAKGFVDQSGYIIEGALKWTALGMIPEEGKTLNLSVAVHDVDRDRSDAKLQWFFRNEKEYQHFSVGKLVLKKAGSVHQVKEVGRDY